LPKREKKNQVLQRQGSEIQLVVFKLGGEEYGVEIGQVREIIRRRVITPMPSQPKYVEGVINVRGTIIPVVNLRKRFELQGDESTSPHTIIVESGDGLMGMLVDSVSEVIRIPGNQIHPPPTVTTGIDTEYLRGICRLEERLLIYLDVEKVVRASPAGRTSQRDSSQQIVEVSMIPAN
jgi:purine-binding chemotaxis protein CheW